MRKTKKPVRPRQPQVQFWRFEVHQHLAGKPVRKLATFNSRAEADQWIKEHQPAGTLGIKKVRPIAHA